MYEHLTEPLLSSRRFFRRLAMHALVALGLVGVSLLIGTLGYHSLGRGAWIDAFLNASMLPGGLGPAGEVTTGGRPARARLPPRASGGRRDGHGAEPAGPGVPEPDHLRFSDAADRSRAPQGRGPGDRCGAYPEDQLCADRGRGSAGGA